MPLVRDSKAALNFTSGSQYISVPDATNLNPTTGITCAVWVKNAGSRGSYRTIISKPTSATWSAPYADYALRLSGFGQVEFIINDAASAANTATATEPSTFDYYHLAATFDGTTMKIYINGVLSGTKSLTATINTSTRPLTIGNRNSSDLSEGWLGKLDDVQLYSRALTATEVLNLYNTNTAPTGCVLNLALNEGAGTTVADTSGNANTGTITAATFTADVPFKPRKLVNDNLVKNGDFSYAPPFSAVETTNSGGRWIDGTAGGSTTNDLFGWGLSAGGTYAVSYGSATFNTSASSLKISLTAVASSVDASPAKGSVTAAQVLQYSPQVLPSTSYTCTFAMKTAYVSGDSDDGAYVQMVEKTGDGSSTVATNVSTKIKTTTNWTNYSFTFTTGATTGFITPSLSVKGNSGTATLIIDAWFDDVTLKPTTAITRLAA